jgi:SAM-dependent methyltransferase
MGKPTFSSISPETKVVDTNVIDLNERLIDLSGQGQIKSRDRVRDLAEVYTHKREVDAMLALVPDMFRHIDTRFLEPACGHGNFLVAILARKLVLINEKEYGGTSNWYEYAVLRAVASIYAVDISDENVFEARERMRTVIDKEFAENGYEPTLQFPKALDAILSANVVCGDALKAQTIRFIDWVASDDESFARTPSYLAEPEFDLFFSPPESLPPIHYSELTSGAEL